MKVAILGLGNVLRRDDAFGPSAVLRLEAGWRFPSCVELQDLGTPGLDLASHLLGRDAVIVLDALSGQGAVGTVREIDLRTLPLVSKQGLRMSGHEGDLRTALLVADVEGRGPVRAHVVGVVPQDLGDGTGLSKVARDAIRPACERVIRRLKTWGIEAAVRTPPGEVDAWWEREGDAVRQPDEAGAAPGE